jgi:putative nucleotidyltransferase with HDIG domain
VVIAASIRIPNPRGGSIVPTTVLSYLAIYVFNPPTALLVVGTAGAVGYVISRGWIPWRAIANGSLMALSVALGASAFTLAGGTTGRIDLLQTYPALIMGPLAQQMANRFFVYFVVSRWRGLPFLNTWLNGMREWLWPNLLSVPTAVMLAILYTRVHYSSILAYLILLPLQWLALRLYIKRRQLYAQIIDGLVVATDVNFPLGQGHARRVADIAMAIAQELRLDERTVESVQFAALLHDVGMIGKDDLLERSAAASEDMEGLQDHVRIGAEIAKELPRKEIAELILRHHEKYNGTGYPEGLSGESIPLGARIIALAEAVDSMASGAYPYPAPMSTPAIMSDVDEERGRAFDPEVVDAFLRTVERGSLELVSGLPTRQQILQAPRLGESPAR